jgi:hypothetical protein
LHLNFFGLAPCATIVLFSWVMTPVDLEAIAATPELGAPEMKSAATTRGLIARFVSVGAALFAIVLAPPQTVFAVDVTIDATDCDPLVIFGVGNQVAGRSSATVDVAPGVYNLQLNPGGFPGPVTVDGAGNVSYAAGLDGSVYTGLGTSTLAIVGHTITVSSLGLDNDAFPVGLTFPDLMHQQLFDMSDYELPVGEYFVQATPGGVLANANIGVDVKFVVEPAGTISYAAGLDQVVLEGLGTSTVTLLGSPVTVAGPELSGIVFETGLAGLNSSIMNKSITYMLSLGNYRLQGGPGYLMDLVEPATRFSVDPAGIVTYGASVDGTALAGLGTNTIEVLPFTVHLDASDSTKDLFILPLDPAPAGGAQTFQLPVGTFTIHAASTPIGSFKLNAAGECCKVVAMGECAIPERPELPEFTFADGIARVRCPRPAEDFKCYKVKDLKTPRFEATSLSLSDGFGVNDGDFEAQKPFLLCNPSETDGQVIFDPATHQVCYKIKGPKLNPSDRPRIEAVTRFGTSQLEIVKPALLCVPSTGVVLP